MIEIIPATDEMIRRFYGGPVPQTVRAVAGVRDGEVLGIGGYYVCGPRVVIFSDIKPEYLGMKKSIVKATRKVLEMVRESGMPAMAVPDDGIDGAKFFLDRLGFIEQNHGVYEWRH